jgi:HTH-type transcriptional regulator / antitoxin HipB
MNAMEQLVTTAKQIGQIVRARRRARKLSQREVAAKLGVSQGRLSVLETDAAGLTLDRLLTLANALGLEIVVRDAATEPATKKKPSRRSEW